MSEVPLHPSTLVQKGQVFLDKVCVQDGQSPGTGPLKWTKPRM